MEPISRSATPISWLGGVEVKNNYIIEGDLVRVLIKKGGYVHAVLLDMDDLEKVKNHSWYLQDGYAMASVKSGGRRTVMMHRLICDPNDNQVVDHINTNRLDNRKVNLRAVGKSENARNRAVITGVHFHKEKKKYQAYIKVDGKRKHVGYFLDRDETVHSVLRLVDQIDPVSAKTKRSALGEH